jgi:hypothetical protein
MTTSDPYRTLAAKKNQVIRTSILTVILASTMLISPRIGAEEIVAILDLRFIENTGEPGGYICFDDDECDVYAIIYLFEASVDKVISGDLSDEKFLVLYARHALREKNLSNVVALLKEREPDEFSAAKYQIAHTGQEREMYCFTRREDEEVNTDVILNEKYPLNCYDLP